MAWIGKSHGTFRLHDSDSFCGSFIGVEDAAEILDVAPDALSCLRQRLIEDEPHVSELDIYKAWGSGRISCPHKPRCGNAARSFDELVVMKLLEITLPGCDIEYQIPFGKKRVDLKVSYRGSSRLIEFVGPSHFIPQREYQRTPISPLTRKQEAEDHFGIPCIIWPFWIQRCSKNVRAMFDQSVLGLASVWSTKALFGDFIYPESASLITEITEQFRATHEDGIGYMYGSEHTNKPTHPIVKRIRDGEESRQKLIPRGNKKPETFWLPKELR
jgi:hypothetical protein